MSEQQQAVNDAEEDKWRYGIEHDTLVGAQRYNIDHEDQH